MKKIDGNRRQFFRGMFGGAVEHVMQRTEDRLVQRRYVRPPGAIAEVGFLAACTRCGLCAAACPPEAIRHVTSQGGLAAGTPFLEPGGVACAACDDMPCVASCPTGALVAPGDGWRGVRLGRVTFHPDRCITFKGEACGICVQACPIGPAALALDTEGRPVLKAEGCVACGMCVQECPTMPSSLTFAPLER